MRNGKHFFLFFKIQVNNIFKSTDKKMTEDKNIDFFYLFVANFYFKLVLKMKKNMLNRMNN